MPNSNLPALDQQMFESAFKFAPIGMTLVSLDGKFLKVNEALCDIWGYSEQELLTNDFQSITHPEDLKHDVELLTKLLNGEMTNYRMEKRYIKKSGQLIWAMLNVSLIRDANQLPLFFISQVMDITESKVSQQTSSYNSKMIALGEMASGIAHEINNPLAIIGLNASVIEEAIKETSAKDAMVFVQKIKNTVMRINEVVVSLRKLSRRNDHLYFERSELKAVINDALSLCQEKIKAQSIVLTCEIDEVSFECRPVEITQVLINLLNNAFFALEGATTREIHLRARSLNDLITIEIIDSGRGIEKDIRHLIMEPFFTTKPLGQGTGLGLSISRNIVDTHHGQLYLDETSKRTKFVMELPITQL